MSCGRRVALGARLQSFLKLRSGPEEEKIKKEQQQKKSPFRVGGK